MHDQNYIIKLAERKAEQLGYSEFRIEPKEFTINSGETKSIAAYGEFYFIVDAPYGISITSDRGEYNKENPSVKSHVNEHSGPVSITNHTDEDVTVLFIHLILLKLK